MVLLMKYKILIIVVVLLALGLTSAYAGNSRRIGTAGAQELRIPFGSRGTAMGGSVIANTYGIEAIYWNPSGLATLDGTEVMFTHLPYFADIDVNFVGAATSVEGFGNLGVTVKSVSIGEMEETTAEDPDGTGRIFNPSLTVIGLTYARTLTANVSFGATANFVNESIFEARATGLAFDMGFIYNPQWKGVSFGVVIKNYGPAMKFTGRGFERPLENGSAASPTTAEFDLPSSINFGMSYNFLDNGPNVATLTSNFRSNNYSDDLWQGGFEYVYNELYSIRAGYNYSEQEDYVYGLSLGAGLVYDFQGTRLSFEYSWQESEFFDDNQYFTVKASGRL